MKQSYMKNRFNSNLRLLNKTFLSSELKAVSYYNFNLFRNINILATLNISNLNNKIKNNLYTLYCSSIFVYEKIALKKIDQNIAQIKFNNNLMVKNNNSLNDTKKL
jgi:hypothetical protein